MIILTKKKWADMLYWAETVLTKAFRAELQPEMSSASHSQLWKKRDPSFADTPKNSSRIRVLHSLKHTCVGRSLCIRYLPSEPITLYFGAVQVYGKATYLIEDKGQRH